MVPGKSSSTHDQLYWARNYYTLDLDRGVIVRWICGQGNWQGGGQEYGQGRKQTKWQTMKGKRWWGSWQADWWTRYWIRHTHLTRFDAMVVTCVIGQLRHRQTNYSVNEKCPVLIDFLHYLQVRLRLSEDSFHPLIYFEYEYVKRICSCLWLHSVLMHWLAPIVFHFSFVYLSYVWFVWNRERQRERFISGVWLVAVTVTRLHLS